jgi:hypothetical protein
LHSASPPCGEWLDQWLAIKFDSSKNKASDATALDPEAPWRILSLRRESLMTNRRVNGKQFSI